MTAVAIVDHERATREWVARMIEASNHFCLHSVHRCGADAIDKLASSEAHIALVEADLPDMVGAKCIHELRENTSGLKVIVYARTEEAETILHCLKAGALGYLTKDIFPTKLLQAIQDVAAGGAYMMPSVARKVVASFQHEKPLTWPTFSEREQEVLALLCKGYSYREIGAQLFVSPNTVRFHLKNIYRKMKVNSRHEAVIKASRVGMVKSD
ncbi:MAG: response regulator [Bacteroidetes bacterium]|jgi:DNA-binding NarL/FixJ family response regulator|nr:response regulator [Bacteroidota bacterium]